jgi:light-regulated signal transduction histidine kinase (bacteriophytochrome)
MPISQLSALADLIDCDQEPILVPGCIQPNGVLLVLDRQGFAIENVAGDTSFVLGVEREHVIGHSLSTLLDTQAESFVAAQLGSPSANVAPIICLRVRSHNGSLPLDLTLSASERTVIIELEPARRTAIDGRDPIAQLKTLLSALHHTDSVQEGCEAATSALRAATGFERAMAYRFLDDGSGVVVAEDAAPGLEPFLGLRYPASDIPMQARELYKRNWLRVIPDVDYVPAPLLPPINARTGKPVDMSQCALRSVSPIHLEYLRNMGVRASMSVSVMFRNELWGMLLLHHAAPRHVSTDLRVACETFAQIFSLHVEAKTQTELAILRINTRAIREEIVFRLLHARDAGTALCSPDLLRYTAATGAAVHYDGRLHCIGETPSSADIMDLIRWLDAQQGTVYATDQLSLEYPPALSYSGVASGLLAVAVSREPRNHVLWFRQEVVKIVKWAGDPTKQVRGNTPGIGAAGSGAAGSGVPGIGAPGIRLAPRKSFAMWPNEKRDSSSPWSEVHIEAAESLRVLLLETTLKGVVAGRSEFH